MGAGPNQAPHLTAAAVSVFGVQRLTRVELGPCQQAGVVAVALALVFAYHRGPLRTRMPVPWATHAAYRDFPPAPSTGRPSSDPRPGRTASSLTPNPGVPGVHDRCGTRPP